MVRLSRYQATGHITNRALGTGPGPCVRLCLRAAPAAFLGLCERAAASQTAGIAALTRSIIVVPPPIGIRYLSGRVDG
jgi:hypothetical protein